MQGLLVFDFQWRYGEAVKQLAAWLRDGRLAYREHILEGLEAAPDAIAMLCRGENTGTLLIRVDQSRAGATIEKQAKDRSASERT